MEVGRELGREPDECSRRPLCVLRLRFLFATDEVDLNKSFLLLYFLPSYASHMLEKVYRPLERIFSISSVHRFKVNSR